MGRVYLKDKLKLLHETWKTFSDQWEEQHHAFVSKFELRFRISMDSSFFLFQIIYQVREEVWVSSQMDRISHRIDEGGKRVGSDVCRRPNMAR